MCYRFQYVLEGLSMKIGGLTTYESQEIIHLKLSCHHDWRDGKQWSQILHEKDTLRFEHS